MKRNPISKKVVKGYIRKARKVAKTKEEKAVVALAEKILKQT